MKIYINKKEIVVWLPNKLFKNLKGEIEEYNQLGTKPKLNFATAAYLMNLFFYLPLKTKDKYENGWIPICSDPYKNLKYFRNYMSFLVSNKFIYESDLSYSTTSKNCKRYKLGGSYGKQVVAYHLIKDNSYFINKINQLKIDRMNKADDKCMHVTKWLEPELLTIDYQNALSYTNKNYKGMSKLIIRKKNKRIYSIKSIENKCWSYSRQGLDNRLHSILTSLPKDIRNYIKYNNESLISYDIKNSQPFILASIINQLINPNINLINNYIDSNNNKLYTSIMSDHFRNSLDINKLQSFINQVMDGTFYEQYGDILYKEGLLSEDINKQCYLTKIMNNPKKVQVSLEEFDNRRKAAKHIVLLTLFSSEKYHSEIIKIFKKYYPEVYKVTQYIKKNRDKNFFPILLQNIEADCILDYCTKKISDKYPEMPLLTIHDSIVTTNGYFEILKREFEKYLKIYFGLQPNLEAEPWTVDLSDAV